MLASHHKRYGVFVAHLQLLALIAAGGVSPYYFDAGACCIVVSAGFVVWLAFVIGQAYYWQGTIVERLEKELGFTHGTAYLGWVSSALVLKSVTPGGPFDRAGFREADVLLDNLGLTEFFQLLANYHGREPITFRVATWDPPRSRVHPETRLITLPVDGAGLKLPAPQ
jgi:hypothetical protein